MLIAGSNIIPGRSLTVICIVCVFVCVCVCVCVCAHAQCIRSLRRWRDWVSLSWRPEELWRDMATKFCAWTGVRTRGGLSAPHRSETRPSSTPLELILHLAADISLWMNKSIANGFYIVLVLISSQDGKVIVWDAFTTNKVTVFVLQCTGI